MDIFEKEWRQGPRDKEAKLIGSKLLPPGRQKVTGTVGTSVELDIGEGGLVTVDVSSATGDTELIVIRGGEFKDQDLGTMKEKAINRVAVRPEEFDEDHNAILILRRVNDVASMLDLAGAGFEAEDLGKASLDAVSVGNLEKKKRKERKRVSSRR